MASGPANLHEGFRDGSSAEAEALVSFLEEADRLPGFVAVRRAMRAAIDVGPGMRLLDVTASPYSFTVSEPVWRRIVHDTLHDVDPAVSAWLANSAQRVADGGLSAVFTGILTTARVPG